MKVVFDPTKRKASNKSKILSEIWKAIESHHPEYHPLLWQCMVEEVAALKLDTTANVPIIQAIVDNTNKTKVQVATDIDNEHKALHVKLGNVMAKQIQDLKAVA